MKLGTAYVEIRADGKRLSSELKKTEGTVRKSASKMQSAMKLVFPVAGAVAFGLAIRKMTQFMKSAVEIAGKMEQWTIAFETMTGSANVAKKLLKDIADFAARTPFQLTGLIQSSKQLLAFGIETENIIDTMRNLGNIAAGVGSDKLPTLVRAFGKIKTKGKATMEELNMLLEAGVPILDSLAKGYNVTTQELFKMITQGEVGFEDVDKALRGLSTGSGMFANLMEKQSESLIGVWSNLQDEIDQFKIALGNLLLPMLKNVIGNFRSLVETGKNVINFLTYGADTAKELTSELDKTSASATQSIYDFKLLSEKLEILAQKENKTKIELEKYKDLINEVNIGYKPYLTNLITEKDTYLDISKNILAAKFKLEDFWKAKRKEAITLDIKLDIDKQMKAIADLNTIILTLQTTGGKKIAWYDELGRIEKTRTIEELTEEIEEHNERVKQLKIVYDRAIGAISETDEFLLSITETTGKSTRATREWLAEMRRAPETTIIVREEIEKLLEPINSLVWAMKEVKVPEGAFDLEGFKPAFTDLENIGISTMQNIGNAMSDALFQLALGTENAAERFRRAWHAALSSIIAKIIANAAILALASLFTGGFAGAAKRLGAKSPLAYIFGFDKGGISPGKLQPIASAQQGGIFKKPTLAAIAEKPGMQEAVIPLQNGRVPVQLGGDYAISMEHMANEISELKFAMMGKDWSPNINNNMNMRFSQRDMGFIVQEGNKFNRKTRLS